MNEFKLANGCYVIAEAGLNHNGSIDIARKLIDVAAVAGVDAVKFRRKVVPGDVLELHVTALRGGGRVWKFAGRAMVDGELACEAEFMAMFDVPKA